MIKFPYGRRDFAELITENYLYLDRTHHIPYMENTGKELLFMRPRRFGKSLWLSTLMNYYDVDKAYDFERLFGHLAVGQNPTPLHNTYLVMRWDFSRVSASGSMEQIVENLNRHINNRIKRFEEFYMDRLNRTINIHEEDALSSFESLMTATDLSGYKLYLFIDEYDNFANEVMMSRQANNHERYITLVKGEGVFKTFFKNMKSAGSGDGLDRVFMTGVSPIVLNDVTSGANTFKDITWHRRLNDLCGFSQDEVRELLAQVIDSCELSESQSIEILEQMRSFYNGSRFVTHVPGKDPVKDIQTVPKVYNPTLTFYLLEDLQENCDYPEEMLDGNLEPDSNKLLYIAEHVQGQQLMLDAVDPNTEISVYTLRKKFGVTDLLEVTQQQDSMAVLLCYLGVLTVGGRTSGGQIRLEIPNLVIRRLYADQILAMMTVDDISKRTEARIVANLLFTDGNIAPICDFVKNHLLSVYSNRDYRAFNELTLKTLFMSILHYNNLYIMDSEPEIMRRYGDLLMLFRPGMYYSSVYEILLEFKFVPLKKMIEEKSRLTEEQIRAKSDSALLKVDVVKEKFDEARKQLQDYRRKLNQKYGTKSRLRTYALVGIGFERILWEEIF